MINSEISINCDFKGCDENDYNEEWHMSCDDLLAILLKNGWGFPSEFDLSLDDETIYCPAHFKAFQLEQKNNIANFDSKEWNIVKKRLVCNEHKIPECDLHDVQFV